MKLTFLTQPNRHVRDSLPVWPKPYEQVVGITDQATPSDSSNAAFDIAVPRLFGDRLLQYWEMRFGEENEPQPQRSCVEFAMYMTFGKLGEDKEDGFRRFDALFRSESSRPFDPSIPLRVGEVVLMGNQVELGDCWCGACCIVHACVGLGEDNPNVLEVKALGGNMSLNPLAESLEYYQSLDFPWSTTSIALRAFMPNKSE